MGTISGKTPRVAVYARVSSEDQVGNTSLDDQLRRCRDEVARRGWDIAAEYVEEGFTGTRASRPAFDRLRRDALRRDFDVVVATKVDRLVRRSWILGQLIDELEPAGVSIIVLEANIDTTTPAGRAMREVMATFAQLDRDQTVEKMARGAHNTAIRGGWPTSRTPFGYAHRDPGRDSTLVIDLDQHAIVLRAVELLVDEGMTSGQTAQHLNALGWTTPYGRRWTHQNLVRKMRSRGLRGEFQWGKLDHGGSGRYGAPKDVRAEPLITEDRWEALQAALDRSRSGRRSGSRLYMLSRRLHCPCGAHFNGCFRADRGLRQYRCARAHWTAAGDPRCDQCRLDADSIEERVWSAVSDLLRDGDRLRACAEDYQSALRLSPVRRDEITTVESEIAKLRRAIVRATKIALLEDAALTDVVGELRSDLAEAVRRHEQLQARLREQEASAVSLRDMDGLARRARERLDLMDADGRAALISTLNVEVAVLEHRVKEPRLRIDGVLPRRGLFGSGDLDGDDARPAAPRRRRCGWAASAGPPSPGAAAGSRPSPRGWPTGTGARRSRAEGSSARRPPRT